LKLDEPLSLYTRIGQDIITITVSEELIDLIDNETNGELILESVRLRQNLADNLGYILPPLRFTCSDEVGENQYKISIRKFTALAGVAYNGYRMFYPGQANIQRKPKGAIESVEPVLGKKVFWIEEEKTKDFWDKGLSPSQQIINNIEFVVRKYVDEILSYGDILNYISLLGEDNLFLAEELIQSAVPLGDMRYIFASLIREKVSIRDIAYIFEKMNDLLNSEYEKEDFIDNLRILLARQICSSISDANNFIYAVIPSSDQNIKLKKALNKKTKDRYFIQNADVKDFIKYVRNKVENSECDISNIAVIVKPELRRAVFYLIEQEILGLSVISEKEIVDDFSIEVL